MRNINSRVALEELESRTNPGALPESPINAIAGPGLGGVSIVANKLSRLSLGVSIAGTDAPHAKYADSVIMSAENDDRGTLAHEVGHILDNLPAFTATGGVQDSHYPYGKVEKSNLDSVNLMVEGSRSVATIKVLGSRRLTSDQQTQMHTARPNVVRDP
jgi:hypothetical protein